MTQQPSRHGQFSCDWVTCQGRQEYTKLDAHHMAVALENTLLSELSCEFRFADNHNSVIPIHLTRSAFLLD